MRMDSPDRPAPPTTQVRRRFVLAASFAALWVVVLGTLSLLTANPVTLNRDQILNATDVLTAVVQDDDGLVRVEKSWKDVVQENEIELPNLHYCRPAVGDRLLIPVTTARDSWRVALSNLPDQPPLVYPVNEESERQLLHLLKHGRLP